MSDVTVKLVYDSRLVGPALNSEVFKIEALKQRTLNFKP